MRYIFLAAAILIMSACHNGSSSSNTEAQMSEKALLLYTKAEKKIAEVEIKVSDITDGVTHQQLLSVLTEVRSLEFTFDSTGMNRAAVEKCKALQKRIVEVQTQALEKAEAIVLQSDVLVYQCEDLLFGKPTEYPVYLEKGDRLYYDIKMQSAVPVKLYNIDAKRTLKSYNKASVSDSLVVAYPGIYLLEIKPQSPQYASVKITYHTENKDRLHNPKSVISETVSCSKSDFRSYAVKAIKMQNIFEEPRKFTLRSQLKSAFSGSSIALVPIQVPAGTTDILYSMRIATSEQERSSDGNFHRNLSVKYNQIKFLGLPLYERNQGSGLLKMLLEDNHPITDADAYCDLYVFRSQAEAKKFQDGTAGTSTLKYDVDYSTVGTQSCNGRVPTNGSSKLYLGFENVRMRYTNYLWVEAIAVIPTTEYYRTQYTVE